MEPLHVGRADRAARRVSTVDSPDPPAPSIQDQIPTSLDQPGANLMLALRMAIAIALIALLGPHSAHAEGWKAGASKIVITPKEPIWMAGYGGRDHPSEGAIHDLWAKALAMEDEHGERALLITVDICGISRPLSNSIRDAIQQAHGLDRSRIVIACSHTHSGPVIGTNLISMYPLDKDQKHKVAAYAEVFKEAMVDVAAKAIKNLQPSTLSWDTGRCGFAVNRRENDQRNVPNLRKALELKGPDDHDVPVLRVTDASGELKAVVCGYACHCTTLQGYKLSGDYAGFAQIALESSHPGAISLFWAGCGADQNPLPRGELDQAANYGTQLAEAVEQVLRRPMNPVQGALRTAYKEIDLAFDTIPDRTHWEEMARSDNRFEAGRAKLLLARIDEKGSLDPNYPYPVQAWRLGDDLLWVFLGGEVVVDYSLRIKRNLGSDRTWVAAYCNDVMAYIPSLRVLKEGGYEGGGAMLYYGRPAPWSDKVEEQVITGVHDVVQSLGPKK